MNPPGTEDKSLSTSSNLDISYSELEIIKEIGRGGYGVVLGVSRDDVETQDKFVCTYNFPFQVLSDKDGKVGEAFEIGKDIFGLVDGRTSYVIDINGNIVSRHHAMIRVSSHVDEALKTLQTLNK
eukprot:TRINITY_DN571_c0_g1_i1.p1 TRINITY_DN571_c0_g1~~TRINITY_DN571_c0_g1_i1.p1  ORF type:complete len:125 (+),score=10.33 TRINITY_DN571_c0_g1_i1:47-421(+)